MIVDSPAAGGTHPAREDLVNTSLLLATLLALAPLAAAAAPGAEAKPSTAALEARVRERERAFARTMTDRDLAAFASFVSEEAVFVDEAPARGRQAVVEAWKALYQGAQAPFSWAPESVYVTASGTLALSSGPVFDPRGNRVGTFSSTWRLEPDGEWRVVLDHGCPPCRCGDKAAPAVQP